LYSTHCDSIFTTVLTQESNTVHFSFYHGLTLFAGRPHMDTYRVH
jgi:hypothetical protein